MPYTASNPKQIEPPLTRAEFCHPIQFRQKLDRYSSLLTAWNRCGLVCERSFLSAEKARVSCSNWTLNSKRAESTLGGRAVMVLIEWTSEPTQMPEAMIISDPKIMVGKPVVRGTRITVELILEKLAAGESEDQILSGHPRLTIDSIRAAIAFAAEALRADVVYPFEKVT